MNISFIVFMLVTIFFAFLLALLVLKVYNDVQNDKICEKIKYLEEITCEMEEHEKKLKELEEVINKNIELEVFLNGKND